MGIKLKDKVQDGKNKSIYEKITPQAINKIKDKTTKKDKKDAKSTEEKVKDTAKKTIKETIKAGLRAVIVFLRSLSLLLSTCGLFSILIMFILLVVVIASVGAIIILLEGDGGGFSNDWSDGSTKKQIASETTDNMNDAIAWREKQVFTDNTTWVNCCNTVFSWYLANIPTYCTKLPGEDGYGKTKWGRGFYSCELFHGGKVGDDCSSYVSNALVYAGFLPSGSLNKYVARNLAGMWKDENNVIHYCEVTHDLDQYFNKYTYADFQAGTYIPRAGDIMAFCGHVEILAQVTDSPVYVWSWGDVKYSNPVKAGRGKNLDTYLSKTAVIWALKDNVVPPSYLEGKTVVIHDETEDEGGSHER